MESQYYLALMVALSVLLYGVGTHLAWARRRRQADRWEVWVQQAGRLAYYIGLPYLTLRLGLGSARMMGLASWTSSPTASVAVALALAAFCLLAVFWWRCGSSLPALGRAERDEMVLPGPLAAVTLDVLCLGIHWAFYRGAFILWFGGDYYSGSFVGLLLVIAERFTNPEIRLALRRPESAALEMSQWGLALCMAAVFFFSRSLALVLLLQWLLAAATLPMERAALRGRRPAAASSPEIPEAR